MHVDIKLRVVTAIVFESASGARSRLIACSVFRTIEPFSVIGMYFYKDFRRRWAPIPNFMNLHNMRKYKIFSIRLWKSTSALWALLFRTVWSIYVQTEWPISKTTRTICVDFKQWRLTRAHLQNDNKIAITLTIVVTVISKSLFLWTSQVGIH